MSNIDVSIIIPTHNRKKIIEKCLKALNQQTYPPEKYEIIVIDDGSTDDTGEMIKKIDLKPELIYRYQNQTGPAGARNHGIELARGSFIIFIDDDIIVTSEFVQEHISMQKKNKKVIVHGPVIYTNNLDNPTSEEMKITDFSRAFFATGNVSIRKEYLLKAGLFNEIFTEYGWEDLEMGHRLKEINLKAIKAEKARGFHLKHSFSPENLPAVLEKERQRGRMAIHFFQVNSSPQVRMTTLYWLPFFWLERILTLGNWPEWKATNNLVRFFHRKNWEIPRNFIVWFMKLKAYFNGMRQGPDRQP